MLLNHFGLIMMIKCNFSQIGLLCLWYGHWFCGVLCLATKRHKATNGFVAIINMWKNDIIALFIERRILRDYSIFEFFYSDKNFDNDKIQQLTLSSCMPWRIFVAQILNNGCMVLVWLVSVCMVLFMWLSLKLLFCRYNLTIKE